MPEKTRSRYQSFETDGASPSQDKLKALRLHMLPNRTNKTNPLKGKSVLDLGCNEGFFCLEALRQGATRVVGIDANKKWIERARERSTEVEYRQGSWWDLPDGKFDVILFLSAIHYETEQKRLLDTLSQKLSPDGVLVLECGVHPAPGQVHWHTVMRGAGDKRMYPTMDLLMNGLLSAYSPRNVGRSVKQSGDPVPRFVFQCQARQNIAILVSAQPKAGKSTLSRELSRTGVPTFSVDLFLDRALRNPDILGQDLHRELSEKFPQGQRNMHQVGKYIVQRCPGEISEALLAELPVELERFTVEGQLLTHDRISKLVAAGLKERGIKVWNMQPG